MISSQQLSALGASIAKLGAVRLAILGCAGIAVMAAVGFAAYRLGRPAMQAIYTGLSAQDVSRITAALAEAGITFDVNEQRNAVLVPFGQTARARTFLAQKGLPSSARAGYELFDQIGSIGLTSFMQEVTRVRALEGEIARTIQSVDGVAAARVHLVIPDPGSFRRERRDPSAAVLMRLDERWQSGSAVAVRHLVAAAVPGMKIEQVSIASTDGRLLASAGDEQSLGSNRLAELERTMARELEQRAGRTLASALGGGGYQVSVTVRLDVDRQQTNETVFDPKSRIERSVRIVRQSGSSEDSGSRPAVGVEANIPKDEALQADGERRRQREDRREELINYELNSKTLQTVREGYRVQRLAAAMVVDRKHIVGALGAGANDAAVEARLGEIKRLVSAAIGANAEREDKVEIAAVDFGATSALPPITTPGLADYLAMNVGTAINALALLGVVLCAGWFGSRVVARALDHGPPAVAAAQPAAAIANEGASALPAPASSDAVVGGDTRSRREPAGSPRARREAVRGRLEAMVADKEDETARIFQRWMQADKVG